ncbi:DUF883 C-terminal domain-containing protein [Caulobacter segnis]|uniref:DUF883 C-terminal domain-containing protein n=1 Tax=Caulobacter segnis TaxID=88688 RepID=UPI00240F6C28|nr:DUF883 C-terminal domain-containing protein [Caulobacter segnis]MDG2520633.1 DUF883 C-terminal domain-containing protein [Caulobacter segnis]
MDEQVTGAAKQAFGGAQAAAGDLTGDATLKTKGKLKKAAGSAQQAYGELTDGVRDVVDDAVDTLRSQFDGQLETVEAYVKQKPLAAIGIAAGVGLVAGLLLRGGSKTIYVRDHA